MGVIVYHGFYSYASLSWIITICKIKIQLWIVSCFFLVQKKKEGAFFFCLFFFFFCFTFFREWNIETDMGRLQDNQYTPLLLKKDENETKLKEERANNEAKLQVCCRPPSSVKLFTSVCRKLFVRLWTLHLFRLFGTIHTITMLRLKCCLR